MRKSTELYMIHQNINTHLNSCTKDVLLNRKFIYALNARCQIWHYQMHQLKTSMYFEKFRKQIDVILRITFGKLKMAKISKDDVLGYLETANMLEISELIKDIEDKFNVSAAAPVGLRGSS